jgi:hypothetical protein
MGVDILESVDHELLCNLNALNFSYDKKYSIEFYTSGIMIKYCSFHVV